MVKTGGLLLVLVAVCLLGGCRTGNTEADAQNMRQEFSQEHYDKTMKAMGKEKELEEEKRKQAEYLKAGGQ